MVDADIVVGGGALPEGGARRLPGAAGQAADGTSAAVASAGGGSQEECYRVAQAKAGKAETERSLLHAPVRPNLQLYFL